MSNAREYRIHPRAKLPRRWTDGRPRVNTRIKARENIISVLSIIGVADSSFPLSIRGKPHFFFSSERTVVSYASKHPYTGISYNEASLSKIKQRSLRILAVALFVRICKQWNYPFPARIYPDDIQPVANLPAGKHSRFYTVMYGSTCIKSTNPRLFRIGLTPLSAPRFEIFSPLADSELIATLSAFAYN